MTTYNETGGYPHPDHIMTHKVGLAAFEAAPDAAKYPEAGPVWQPLKLYYDVGFSRPKFVALHEAIVAEGLKSPFEERIQRVTAEDAPPDRTITTRVDCAKWFDRRDQALLAHATQIDPAGWFFSIPRDLQARVWPTEDFELARSLVETQIPEDDLFAGIRELLAD
jgi:mycothiol S-conjugate amidase